MLSFNLKAEEKFDPKHHVEKILGTGGRGRCHGGVLGAGADQPLSLPSERGRALFLLRGRRHDEDANRNRRGRSRGALSSTRAASCTNGKPGRSARCCSGCATARNSRAAPRNGRATPSGSRGRRTSSISRRGERDDRSPRRVGPGSRPRCADPLPRADQRPTTRRSATARRIAGRITPRCRSRR